MAFLSTLSLRRATLYTAVTLLISLIISIHALLAESDKAAFFAAAPPINISIHALLAESDLMRIFSEFSTDISIHALLAESDMQLEIGDTATEFISIHALLAESDSDPCL